MPEENLMAAARTVVIAVAETMGALTLSDYTGESPTWNASPPGGPGGRLSVLIGFFFPVTSGSVVSPCLPTPGKGGQPPAVPFDDGIANQKGHCCAECEVGPEWDGVVAGGTFHRHHGHSDDGSCA